MTFLDALNYEIRSRPWVGRVSWPWAQRLAAWYLGRLTARKWRRYESDRAEFERVMQRAKSKGTP